MRSSRHHAAAAAFATAQAFDELGNRRAGLEPEPHKVMLRDDAVVLKLRQRTMITERGLFTTSRIAS